MEDDVTRLLNDVGKRSHPNTLLEIAASLKSEWSDQYYILDSVAKGTRHRLAATIKALPQAKVLGLDPAERLDRIIYGIFDGQHADVAEYLRSQGLNEAANRVLKLENEPPF